jgi:DNA-directed RNA polymerase specialized sigma24 family protein
LHFLPKVQGCSSDLFESTNPHRAYCMKKNSVITREGLDQLLAWLDPDREQAGVKYEKIRYRLIEIFASRGCQEAEDLADEVINRVARKSQDVAEGYVGDPAHYFYAVAKNVRKEYWKVNPPPEIPPTPEPISEEQLARESACLEQCLGHLPEQSREQFLQYHGGEQQVKIGQRKELCNRLDISPNALRIRIHRIGMTLKRCLENCLGQTTET